MGILRYFHADFYIFASLGVFVFGLSKGGVPGPIAMLAVPVMSFAMSPLQAAGICLLTCQQDVT